MKKDLSASVLARLLNLSKQRGEDHSLLLNRFALERFLYRLGVSRHAHQFLLKGALLFTLWYDDPHRPTRDADLLGFGPEDDASLVAAFRELAGMALDDGIVFDAESVRPSSIREDNTYGGTRIHLTAHIGPARCVLQIDIGFGDAVTPPARTAMFPALLPDFEAPQLRTYPVYTVIAEKYHAMVVLDLANSRMKDFYDLMVIAQRTRLDGATLAAAMAATFARRATPLPGAPPLALTARFGEDAGKVLQWQAFLRKNRRVAGSLAGTVELLSRLLWPATQVAAAQSSANASWIPEVGNWV